MNEHERIREEVCGCRYDVATGIKTHICGLHSSDRYRVTLYRGRPTRGAKLKPVLTIICDPYTPHDPWKREPDGTRVFNRMGLHDIKRRIAS